MFSLQLTIILNIIGKAEDMEIMSSLTLLDKMLSGEKVTCPKCHKGFMIPTFPNHKKKIDFHCNQCGYKIHFDHAIEVK